MPGKISYEDVFQQFSAEGFRIGPHKAYQIARDASKVRLMFYSEMDETFAKGSAAKPDYRFAGGFGCSAGKFATR